MQLLFLSTLLDALLAGVQWSFALGFVGHFLSGFGICREELCQSRMVRSCLKVCLGDLCTGLLLGLECNLIIIHFLLFLLWCLQWLDFAA